MAIPKIANLPAAMLKPVVKRWHTAALRVITTKGFDETWADFVNAWQNVQYALGESPMDRLMERLECLPPPAEVGDYDTPKVRILVAMWWRNCSAGQATGPSTSTPALPGNCWAWSPSRPGVT